MRREERAEGEFSGSRSWDQSGKPRLLASPNVSVLIAITSETCVSPGSPFSPTAAEYAMPVR